MTESLLDEALRRVGDLEIEARKLLGRHEAAPERVITLEQSYEKLEALSVEQDEQFREALRAIEAGLFRAAHVLGWAGFIDFLHNHLWEHYQSELVAKRPRWSISSAEDLRETPDYAAIEAGKDIGAYGKTPMKALHGLLNTRNECAHPSDFFPDLNDALGYLSSLFKRIEFLQKQATKD